MSDSVEVDEEYKQIINRAIDFSIFLQEIFPMGIMVQEKSKNVDINLTIDILNIDISKNYTKDQVEPLRGKEHIDRIIHTEWGNTEWVKNKSVDHQSYEDLKNYNWDCERIKKAQNHLNTQLNNNTSIDKFYKYVLIKYLKNRYDELKSCTISGGKSRRRRRKTNKKKTRKAKKKTNKKKRKGNKKRKTRSRTRRKH